MFTQENLMNLADKLGYNVYGTWSTPDDRLVGLWIDGQGWNPFTSIEDAMLLAADFGLVVDCYHMRVISSERLSHGHNDWEYADLDEDESVQNLISRYALKLEK